MNINIRKTIDGHYLVIQHHTFIESTETSSRVFLQAENDPNIYIFNTDKLNKISKKIYLILPIHTLFSYLYIFRYKKRYYYLKLPIERINPFLYTEYCF